jgi:hypothetical protein
MLARRDDGLGVFRGILNCLWIYLLIFAAWYFFWPSGASGEIVRVDCAEVAYAQHWDTSEEALARGGTNSGPYILGETFLNRGDHIEWDVLSGTLPLRLGIKLEGVELVIHKDSTTQAQACFAGIQAGDITECLPAGSFGRTPGDNELWVTAEGAPTSLTFVPNDSVIPYHSWIMYPVPCRIYEHDLGFCDQQGPCVFNEPGNNAPCASTNETVAEMRTDWLGATWRGFGRWAGTATMVLDTATSNLGIRFNTTMKETVSTDAGVNRNIRFRFYDDNLNLVMAHVIRSDVERPHWDPAYPAAMFMDGIEVCFASTDGQDQIRVATIDSVDGQRWSLRGAYHDPAYAYAAADVIPQTLCEPPIAGLQIDWDRETNSAIRDPSPHVANHVNNWHAWSPDSGDHEAHEQICGHVTDGPESMACYCSPDEASMLQCCAELVPEPGALAMLVTGGALLLVLRRRRWDSS